MHARRGLLWGVFAGIAILAGCTEQVGDVNRVQPHYTEKSALAGEWYYRQTVVDHPPEVSYLFTGIEGDLRKIRWEIRERELVAYQIHEHVPGLNADDARPGGELKGSPIAVFTVLEHFDIIRDFNAATGQQSNVLVEDTTLRPWYERKYLRVDWSSNRLADPVDLGRWLQGDGRFVFNSDTYWVRETEAWDPNHMQVTGDLIMFTNRYSISDQGFTCLFLYGLPFAAWYPKSRACGMVQVLVRNAFVKIDAEEIEQFEAVPYLDRDLLRASPEPFEDRDGNGRYDGPEHFTDQNGNGRRDGNEPYVDRNGNGRWDDAEPYQDLNRNGRWDDIQHLKYVTISVGENKDHLVDVACTPEVLRALAPDYTAADCRDLQWAHHGRFGFFRSERTAYDRRVGGGHDANRQFFANHHQIWKRTKDADGRAIPPAQRELRPVVYYLNPNFPEDLKATAGQIGVDWNAAFMEAAVAATGRSEAEIGEQLAVDFAAADPLAVFLADEHGDRLDERALFQVRDNNCSYEGVTRYLVRNPDLVDVFNEGTDGALDEAALAVDAADAAALGRAVQAVRQSLKAGNLERTCSGLTFYSRARGAEEPFVWQQMGDPRFSFVWWVNENQPSGPLGYGPSSADIENGRIISGNAYVYGASVDVYARSAADVVRAMNGTLCEDGEVDELACLRDGRSYFDWIAEGPSVADRPVEVTPELQREISRRIGSAEMGGYREFRKEQGGVDKAAMMRHMRDRMRHTSASDPIAATLDAPVDEGRARIEKLKQNPSFRAKMVSDEMLQLVGRLYGWRPGEEVPEEMFDLALELSVDPSAMMRRQQAREAFYAERNVYLPEHLDDSVIGQALQLKGRSPEEVYQILRREIFRGVMLHEIGHTVGLRHNFKASFDALNYHDEFWHIRERYPEHSWHEHRLPEYRYASIMDYGARFNSDTKGLGKYDHAAIKYVYGGHVEAFAEAVPVPGRFDLELEFSDYRKIPDLLGGDLDNLYRRQDRPVGEVMAEARAGVQKNAELYLANPDRAASDYWSDRTVPYAYCDDGYRGDIKCRTWDEGASHTEAVQSAIQNYWNYYQFNSWRRKRDESVFLNGFFSRQARLMEYLQYPWKYYYFYDAYDIDTRGDLLQAAMLGMNFINQVLGTPEPGRYCREGAFYIPAWWRAAETQRTCDAIDVPLGTGRYMYLEFSDDYDYRIDYLGLYYDKINFFRNLVDTYSDFYRVTDFTDNRRFTIGYYLAFKDETVDLLRDMMYSALGYLTRGSRFNNYVVSGKDHAVGKVRPQLFADPKKLGAPAPVACTGAEGGFQQNCCGNGVLEKGEECDDGDTDGNDHCLPSCQLPRIYSAVPYNLAWQGIALSTIFNSTRFDRLTDFVEYIHIAEAGSGDDRTRVERADEVMGACRDAPDQACRTGFECASGACDGYSPPRRGAELARFSHPVTGQTYVAAQTADGRSLSYELLQLAAGYVQNSWLPARQALDRNPTDPTARQNFENVDYTLQNFAEFMDDLRELQSWVDWAR